MILYYITADFLSLSLSISFSFSFSLLSPLSLSLARVSVLFCGCVTCRLFLFALQKKSALDNLSEMMTTTSEASVHSVFLSRHNNYSWSCSQCMLLRTTTPTIRATVFTTSLTSSSSKSPTLKTTTLKTTTRLSSLILNNRFALFRTQKSALTTTCTFSSSSSSSGFHHSATAASTYRANSNQPLSATLLESPNGAG